MLNARQLKYIERWQIIIALHCAYLKIEMLGISRPSYPTSDSSFQLQEIVVHLMVMMMIKASIIFFVHDK